MKIVRQLNIFDIGAEEPELLSPDADDDEEEIRELSKGYGVLELVDGPITITHTCGHQDTVHCIQTTRGHLNFLASGECLSCWRIANGRD